MAKHILMINGPNLNLLGLREPHIYGATTLPSLQSMLEKHCASLSDDTTKIRIHLSCFQSNHEGAILDVLHSCHPKQYTFNSQDPSRFHHPPDLQENSSSHESEPVPKVSGIIINPGALTHTSVTLRDALVGVGIPFIEVHITNVHAREAFRHHSFLSEKAVGVICGLGVQGYVAALDWFVKCGANSED